MSYSRTLPASSTSTRSLSMIVCSRCAIVSTVQSANAVAMVACMGWQVGGRKAGGGVLVLRRVAWLSAGVTSKPECAHACPHACQHARASTARNTHLDERVCARVHVAGGLVQHQDARGPQQRACHAQQLALAHAQVAAALGDGRIQAAG